MYFLSGSSRLQSFELSNQAGTRFDRGILTKHSKHQRWMLDGVGCGRDAGWSLIECFEAPGPQSPVKRLRCLMMLVAWLCTTPKHINCHRPLREELHPWIWPWAEVISCWFKGTGDWWGLCCDHFLSLNPHFPWLDHHFLWLNTTLNQH